MTQLQDIIGAPCVNKHVKCRCHPRVTAREREAIDSQDPLVGSASADGLFGHRKAPTRQSTAEIEMRESHCSWGSFPILFYKLAGEF